MTKLVRVCLHESRMDMRTRTEFDMRNERLVRFWHAQWEFGSDWLVIAELSSATRATSTQEDDHRTDEYLYVRVREL